MGPDFSTFGGVDLRNMSTGYPARLVRADAMEPTAALAEQVTRLCNEPRIYDRLFRQGLAGASYPSEKAAEFLERAARGWRERTHFVFFIVRATGSLAGNVEIEAADLDGSEIGLWASERSSGFMTPAVAAVCGVARAAGYRSLYAHVRTDNERSLSVLRRNGFDSAGAVGGGDHWRFVKTLD